MYTKEQSEKYSKHHCLNQDSGEIRFVTRYDEIFETLKNVHSLCGEVFPCPCGKHVCVSIRYYAIFLGFTLCELCTDAIDSMSKMPFVIVNAKTGERHGLELRLLK